jgi:hypothetical protein
MPISPTKCGNGSTSNATHDIIDTDDSSIYKYVVALGNQPHSRSVLKSSDLGSFPHYKVKFLPSQYNGDDIYKLPPILASKEGIAGRLIGMDRSCDGHAWTKTQTSNLSYPLSQLTFQYVKCLGHLRCINVECPHLTRTNEHNDIYWEGNSLEVIILGPAPGTSTKCTIVCRFCKNRPISLKLCLCKMFYIIPKKFTMSRAAVHIGFHNHPVATRDCREAMDMFRSQIMAQVALIPKAKNSAIGLAVGKELLLKGLLDESGNGRKLSEEELEQVLDK